MTRPPFLRCSTANTGVFLRRLHSSHALPTAPTLAFSRPPSSAPPLSWPCGRCPGAAELHDVLPSHRLIGQVSKYLGPPAAPAAVLQSAEHSLQARTRDHQEFPDVTGVRSPSAEVPCISRASRTAMKPSHCKAQCCRGYCCCLMANVATDAAAVSEPTCPHAFPIHPVLRPLSSC